jgi:hypothetical protein
MRPPRVAAAAHMPAETPTIESAILVNTLRESHRQLTDGPCDIVMIAVNAGDGQDLLDSISGDPR